MHMRMLSEGSFDYVKMFDYVNNYVWRLFQIVIK